MRYNGYKVVEVSSDQGYKVVRLLEPIRKGKNAMYPVGTEIVVTDRELSMDQDLAEVINARQ